jgi:hypothetical protein
MAGHPPHQLIRRGRAPEGRQSAGIGSSVVGGFLDYLQEDDRYVVRKMRS